MSYSTTMEQHTVSDAFAKVERDDTRIFADQSDLIVVLLFVAIGALLTATFFAAGSLADFGQILAAAG
jgi:hypothetical protein